MFTDTNPVFADTDNILLAKIAQAVSQIISPTGINANTRKLTLIDDFASVGGDVVHDAVDSGNPIKIGGRAISGGGEPVAVASGDRVSAFFDVNGRLHVKLSGKDAGTLLASAARTSSTDSSAQTHNYIKGVTLVINITSVSGAASVTPKIQVLDSVSSQYADLAAFGAISSVGIFPIQLYPGIDAVSGIAVSKVLPRLWRFRMEHANADSITYSVAYQLEI